MKILASVLLLLVVTPAVAFGCAAGRTEGREAARWPPDVRADYRVFALRCSKCHSLARSLNSGIDNDDYWKLYVDRMRRQPASGISVADTVPILRFLRVYAAEQRHKKEHSTAGFSGPTSLPTLHTSLIWGAG